MIIYLVDVVIELSENRFNYYFIDHQDITLY